MRPGPEAPTLIRPRDELPKSSLRTLADNDALAPLADAL